jgi:hypothetical protein
MTARTAGSIAAGAEPAEVTRTRPNMRVGQNCAGDRPDGLRQRVGSDVTGRRSARRRASSHAAAVTTGLKWGARDGAEHQDQRGEAQRGGDRVLQELQAGVPGVSRDAAIPAPPRSSRAVRSDRFAEQAAGERARGRVRSSG